MIGKQLERATIRPDYGKARICKADFSLEQPKSEEIGKQLERATIKQQLRDSMPPFRTKCTMQFMDIQQLS